MKFRYDKESEELVVSSATRIEYHQLNIWLTRKVKNWKYMPAVKAGIWDGNQTYFKNGRVNLGLWKECVRGCQEIGASFILENKEDFPIDREVTLEKVTDFCKDFFKHHKVKTKDSEIQFMPYEHQIETAYKILKNRYCMAEVATSGGKSLIISIVMFYILKNIKPDAKFLLIVPSISLVTQFYDNILEYNFGETVLKKSEELKVRPQDVEVSKDWSPCEVKVEEIMSDKPRKYSGGGEDPNIFIGTYQSLEKWPKNFFKQFYAVACDEAHGSKSNTVLSILKRTFKHAQIRFGVSGTFPLDDSCEILTIQSVLGPKITEITATQLKNKGIITPMQIKSLILNHNEPELSQKLDYVRKKGAGADVFRYEKSFIQNSQKRIELIKKLVGKCDKNTLLLFHTIEYGQKLFKELSESFPDKNFFYIDGEVSGKKREEIKKEMEKNDSVKILIASFGTLSTGVSIKNLHYLIMADSFKSEQIIIQSIGRLLRLVEGKEKAMIFDLVDVFVSDSPKNILYRQYLEREKFYKKRNYPFTVKKINLT